jgi:hypothetical protein
MPCLPSTKEKLSQCLQAVFSGMLEHLKSHFSKEKNHVRGPQNHLQLRKTECKL